MKKQNATQLLRFRFLPSLFAVDDATYSGAFKNEPVAALYNLGFDVRPVASVDDAGLFLWQIADSFLTELSRTEGLELSRENTSVLLTGDLTENLLSSLPFAPGSENVNAEWIQALWANLNGCFSYEIKNYSGTVALYLAEKDERLKVAERIFFHLVENKNDDKYPFSFLATYSTKDEKGSIKHAPLKYALTEYKNDRDKILELLSCLNRVAEVSKMIGEFTSSGEMFHPLRLTTNEAWQILRDIPKIEESGIVCRIPDWWKKSRQKARVSVSLTKKKSLLGLDSILGMEGYLEVDGEKLTKSEIKKMLAMDEGLSLIKGKWVEVDHERLNLLLKEMEKYQGDISMLEALRMSLNSGNAASDSKDKIDINAISNATWISELLRDLRSVSSTGKKAMKLPSSFKATLRPYQSKGYEWLSKMTACNFGACLADDMGLGKTVQVLAFLEKFRVDSPDSKILLVVPASLLGNWQNECKKFAPLLPLQILHSSVNRNAKNATRHAVLKNCQPENAPSHAELDSASLILNQVQNDSGAIQNGSFPFLSITTYSMVNRMEDLQQTEWDLVILDEAQAIKNPSSKQTKSIKSLKAKNRIALTGTPIENDLTNLWSLYDFLNKGLLGNSTEFKRFASSLKENPSGYSKLKAMISPFMLRRLKTDKSIISDLPEKMEMTDYVTLSQKQRVLYKKYVDDLAKLLEKAKDDEDPMKRRGLVLASLLKLKQICNHPDQFNGADGFAEKDSGKFEMLKDICQTIYEKRERVLVFTQFKEICPALDNFLSGVFGIRGFVLHGGTPISKRNKMVEEFQSDTYIPYLVISVKAGGTGLNLTNANHVIHFDRWWNPAVENQATDRAFRIGQTKNIMVHKFVSRGTIEEKIDELIKSKIELAQNVISADSGESWITEMSDSDLMNMFRLDGEE
ncbi:DEAD/DEAH box helicase [Treponema zioleckii]|uniref:DEAD/DEAH box helicase n=1 Tax=Treponema zioleckii TaxID=331680 RepID=UPI0018D6791D|nr:DEAD/DEAH box helicase [Treponema zioleckii]